MTQRTQRNFLIIRAKKLIHIVISLPSVAFFELLKIPQCPLWFHFVSLFFHETFDIT